MGGTNLQPSPRSRADGQPIRLFLCGDVMIGRGIDQALPHPGNPVLYESYVRDARDYVRLAEDTNGPIPRPVGMDYIWGDALAELRLADVDMKIINLETAITRSEDAWPGKGIHYRMSPANIRCLTAAGIDCCILANNHVLDWGYEGLRETLATLDTAGIAHAGAGRSTDEAVAPAILPVLSRSGHANHRMLVFSIGLSDSGIPPAWAAAEQTAGVHWLADLSTTAADCFLNQIRPWKQNGDIVVASIHWGSNWGYEIPPEQVAFAHRLIDGGVEIVHGHSSHHVKAIEVYRDRLILYGCGDFLTDYEGISGHEHFRGDLALMYLPRVDPRSGRIMELRLIPMQSRRFRLHYPSPADARWLCDLLNREGARFGTQVRLENDNSIRLV